MKTVIITGANSGLGYECTANILSGGKDFHVIMACRNPEKAMIAREALVTRTGNSNVQIMQLDLSSQQSVRKFADEFNDSSFPPLHAIVCNAGIAGIRSGKTDDGYELVFGTNHLGHFLLVNLLLRNLVKNGRVVVVSSDMHNPPGGISYPGSEVLADPDNGLKNIYPQSKLCNLYFAYELSRKLQKAGSAVTVNAFNPGLITETNLSAGHKERFTAEFLESVRHLVGSLPVSSKALADMVTEPYFGEVTARYSDRGNVVLSSELSYNPANAAELWDSSCRMTGIDDAIFPSF